MSLSVATGGRKFFIKTVIMRPLSTFPFRGFDTIRLAPAMVIHEKLPEDFVFVCFDDRLALAAQSEGLETFPL